MRGDNARLRKIDEAMGFVEPDGDSPALIAERQGVAGHIIGDQFGLPVVAWESNGVWSYCVLNRYRFLTTTLLARSEKGLLKLLKKLYERTQNEEQAKAWQSYYSQLWENRYRRWCCKQNPRTCDCQLCRIARG